MNSNIPNFEILTQFYQITKQSVLGNSAPWAKYILISPDNPQYERIKEQLLIHPNIKRLTTKLEDPILGINSFHHLPADYRVSGSFYWVLRFIADIGLTATELRIEPLIKQLQLQQLEEGSFMIRYHCQKRQTISLVCMTAHLTYCLIRLGYRESATVNAALNYILTTQRKDGSWHCERLRQNGEREELAPGCLAANMHILRVLGQYGNKYQAFAIPAINRCQLISSSASFQSCEFDPQQPHNWNKLRYPPHWTGLDILNVLHTLSLFPQLVIKSNFASMINFILNQWDGKNWLRTGKTIPEWAGFDFGKNHEPSEWITSLFLQAIECVLFDPITKKDPDF